MITSVSSYFVSPPEVHKSRFSPTRSVFLPHLCPTFAFVFQHGFGFQPPRHNERIKLSLANVFESNETMMFSVERGFAV